MSRLPSSEDYMPAGAEIDKWWLSENRGEAMRMWSAAIFGRPPREQDFNAEYRRKPARCALGSGYIP